MARSVDDLIDETRSQLDETNVDNVTPAQILAALNRAQRKAANIVSRQYDEMFWESKTITTTAGQRDYELPPEAFGRRVELVEVIVGETAYPIKRINQGKRSQFVTSSQVTRPYYYAFKRNKLQLFPKPSGGLTIRLHYTRRPEDLVVPQGRITSVSTAGVYVLVDSLGADLTTNATSGYGAYVNVVDYQTGAVKRTLQILSIDTTTKQVKFKTTSLTRSTVLDRTVSTNLDTVALADDVEYGEINVDDYICGAAGTCVPELDEAYTDYLIQHAVVGIRRRFGEPIQEEMVELRSLEDELQKMWSGRESSHRVRKANTHFSRPLGGNIRRLLS